MSSWEHLVASLATIIGLPCTLGALLMRTCIPQSTRSGGRLSRGRGQNDDDRNRSSFLSQPCYRGHPISRDECYFALCPLFVYICSRFSSSSLYCLSSLAVCGTSFYWMEAACFHNMCKGRLSRSKPRYQGDGAFATRNVLSWNKMRLFVFQWNALSFESRAPNHIEFVLHL